MPPYKWRQISSLFKYYSSAVLWRNVRTYVPLIHTTYNDNHYKRHVKLNWKLNCRKYTLRLVGRSISNGTVMRILRIRIPLILDFKEIDIKANTLEWLILHTVSITLNIVRISRIRINYLSRLSYEYNPAHVQYLNEGPAYVHFYQISRQT